jgi:hypothetical protein
MSYFKWDIPHSEFQIKKLDFLGFFLKSDPEEKMGWIYGDIFSNFWSNWLGMTQYFNKKCTPPAQN